MIDDETMKYEYVIWVPIPTITLLIHSLNFAIKPTKNEATKLRGRISEKTLQMISPRHSCDVIESSLEQVIINLTHWACFNFPFFPSSFRRQLSNISKRSRKMNLEYWHKGNQGNQIFQRPARQIQQVVYNSNWINSWEREGDKNWKKIQVE